MKLKVNFIERRGRETGSIEAVFGQVADELSRMGVDVIFQKMPFGNSAFGMVKNFFFFEAEKADVYHITGHVHYAAMRLPADRTVLTVHDLGILRVRRGLRRWVLKKILIDLPVGRLKYITAISEYTKRELVEQTGCLSSKIRVIANPLRPTFRSDGRNFRGGRPVILQIGTAPHKNLEKVAEALRGLDCSLRIVGPLSDGHIRVLAENEIEYENVVDITEKEMQLEYANADVVAFCSTFEGFGLPIVEAQAMSVPLLTSDLDPMRQVAGDGAVLANPHNAKDIRQKLELILTNREVRDAAVCAGTKNVKRFEATLIASEYLGIYNTVLESINEYVSSVST